MTKKLNPINLNIILVFLNILFFAYYASLAYYSRLHYDDLHFLWKLRELSVGDYVKDMYLSRSGRFVDYFLTGIQFKIIISIGEYRFYPLIFWIIGVSICLYVAIHLYTKSHLFLLFNSVLLFYNLFILTNIDFAVFNWLCAMSYYLIPPMLILTIYLLNINKLKSIFDYTILFLISLILGGSSEAFTPIVLATLFVNFLYYYKVNKYNISVTWTDNRVKDIFLISFIVFICFIVVVIAPGNYARMEMDEFKSPSGIFGYLKGFAEAIVMFFYYFFFYIPYYLVLAVLFIYIGLAARASEFNIGMKYKKIVFSISLLFIVYLLLSVFPSVFLWGGFGIQRNYTHVVYFTMMFFVIQAFLFGYFKTNERINGLIKKSLPVGLLIMCCLMAFNIYMDSMSAREYAESVDKRISYLREMNRTGVKGVVEVDPISIPYTTDPKYQFYKLINKKNNSRPVLYYVSDTDTFPNEHAFHLKKYYGFNFMIRLKSLPAY